MIKKSDENKFSKVMMALIAGCFVFLAVFLIYGCIVSPELGFFNEDAGPYTGVWTLERADGTTEEFTMPVSLDIPLGEAVRVSTILPTDIDDGICICLYTGKSFKLYIEETEIYSFDNHTKKIPGIVVKSLCIPINLKSSYAGHKMTIVRSDNFYNNGKFNTVYIGSHLGVIKLILANHSGQFLCAFLLAILSVMTIVIFVTISFKQSRTIPLIYLAEGVLVVSLWIIFDSPVFQFVFGKYYIDGVMGYMLAILLALPFFGYFNVISNREHEMHYYSMEFLSIANFVVLTILHFTNILSFNDALVYIDGMVIFNVLAILIITLKDYILAKEKEHTPVMIGFLVMGFFALGEIIVTILNNQMKTTYNVSGVLTVIGLFLFLAFAIFDQIKVLGKMQRESEHAMAATRAKSDFLANMSHEIRTPINAILGMNEMILRESNQDNIIEYAKDVNGAGENLLEIINDILDFSKIESGKLEIIEGEYNFGEVICDVASLVNMKAENKGLNLRIQVNPGLPKMLYGDDKRVKEIMTNILNNAVKYTNEGEIILRIDGKVSEDIANLVISVKDTGQGIKPENLDKIFQSFGQVNTKKNKNIEGTGLGLSITKNLVELMNGTIGVESEFGVGSTFTVNLPQRVVGEEKMGDYRKQRHATKDTEVAENKEFVAPYARVLVVDDAPLNLKVIKKLLERNKIQVFCASGGAEALEMMKNQFFDIILMDHMMPDMDGIETLENSKKLEGNKCLESPVLALTANAIVGAKEMYMEKGFNDYLSKPIAPNELEMVLVKYLPKDKIQWI